MMNINNFQIMVGDGRCNANCKFCISRVTYPLSVNSERYKRFDVVRQLAERLRITTAVLTGKGEPTLEKPEILEYVLMKLKEIFPIVELQTNGIGLSTEMLEHYYRLGLTTVCLSRCHYEDKRNNEIMGLKDNQSLDAFKNIENPLCRRMTVTMCNGFIDDVNRVIGIIRQCIKYKFEQLTLHPVDFPSSCSNTRVESFARAHKIHDERLEEIEVFLNTHGSLIYKFPWGGSMYSIGGLTIVFGYCLDKVQNRGKGAFHSLILGYDGHIRLSWEHKGSMIL